MSQSDHPEIPTLIIEEDLIQDKNYKSTFFLIVSGSLLIAGAIVFLVLKKKQSSQNTHLETSLYGTDNSGPDNAIDDGVSLPQDLQQVIDIIKADGGKITQRDLRRKLSYSEAKVSLMVSDLENRGIIEKIKKGRGNIIVLKQRNHQNI